MSKLYFSLRYFVIFLLTANAINSDAQSLACNGGVNISMDQFCEVVMSAAHVLKGPDANANPSGFLLSLKNPNGTKPSNLMVSSFPDKDFIPGSEGEYIKFDEPGSYIVSVKRKSDGTRCWGDLLIEDKLPPYTEDCPCAERRDGIVPDSCMFSCATVGLFFESDSISGKAGLNPVFKDNCGNTGDISFLDILTQDTICGNWIITRTWKSLVPDSHGKMVLKDLNCKQKFLFKNVGIKAIIPPSKKVVVTCGIDTDPESLRKYFSDTTYFLNPDLDSALINSYPTLHDTVPGNGVIIRNIGQGIKPGTNDGLCKITATYRDTPIIPHCGDIGYKFVRTWYVIDWCTNETLEPLTQIIKVMDNEAPGFKIKDTIKISSTNPWTCNADIIVPAPDTMYDNCVDASKLSWIAFVQNGPKRIEANAANGYRLDGLGQGTFIVTYVVTDPCDNYSDKTALLTIKDLVKPVALSKRTIKVTFTTFQGECVAKVFPYNIDAGSFDACDDQLDYAVRRKGIGSFGPFVKFSGDDITDVTPGGTAFGEVKVELRVTDDCGNFNIAWSTVVLEDKNTEVTKICGPSFISLDCSADIDSAIVQNAPRVILNGCTARDLPIDYKIKSSQVHELCNTGKVIVDYFVVGSRDTICTKTFNFGSLESLKITWPSPEIIVTCDETNYGDVILSGGNCNKALASEKFQEFNVPYGLGFCKKIVRTITVIDWCNYVPNQGDTIGIYRFVQTIKVVDYNSPTIECKDLEVSGGADCGVSGLIVTAKGFDDGDCIEPLKWEAAVDRNDDGFYDLNLKVLSAGGNNVSARIDSLIGAGVHNVRWRATDNCGNSSEVFCTITVTDNKAPSPQCISTISTTTMSTDGTSTIWAADFNANGSSTDNCGGPLTFSFSGDDPNVPGLTFTCDDIANNVSAILDLKVYVWDQSGNRDFCNVKLRIDDHVNACPDSNTTATLLITGTIVTPNGDKLESAQVQTKSMNTSTSVMEMTNINGEYAFAENELMSDYEISAKKSDDYLNGVSTLDILLIQRHILNFKNLDNPYKIIAADANGDERISASDLVVLRSLLLGRIDALPNGLSWRIINANQKFDVPESPWPLEEQLYLSELRTSMDHQDFMAVKIGDVNGNAIANSYLIGNPRNRNEVKFKLDDRTINKGELVQFELDMNEVAELHGVQLNFQLESGKWVDVQNNSLEIQKDHFNINDANLKISWTSLSSVKEFGKLILTFEAKKDGKLSDFISLSNRNLSSEVYFGLDFETAEVSLEFYDVEKEEFALYQNVPNPFSGETLISFKIAEAGTVELAIFDLTGRQLFGQSNYYHSGRHEINIDKSIVDHKGILYYQLSYGNKVATRKMISLD